MKNLLYKGYNNNYNIDLTVHSCNNHLYNDIEPVFKNSLKKSKKYMIKNIKIVCTWQKSRVPINIISEEVSKEMNKLYENFINYIKVIKEKVEEKDFWLDASDPHTGKCLFGEKSNCIYNELQGLKYLLKYESEKMGCCGMVFHPTYQYHGYPITFFTDAPIDMLKKILCVS